MTRPRDYTNEQLIEKFKKYTLKHPDKKINKSELARESGIPLHVWKYYENKTKLIEQYENTPIIANPYHLSFTFLTGEQIVNKFYKNKPSLIRAIQDVIDTVHELYDKSIIGIQAEEQEQKFIQQIEELKAKLRLKDEEIDKLNREIDDLYLESENPIKRKKMGIKDNLIELSPEKVNALSKKPEDIRKNYKNLFE